MKQPTTDFETRHYTWIEHSFVFFAEAMAVLGTPAELHALLDRAIANTGNALKVIEEQGGCLYVNPDSLRSPPPTLRAVPSPPPEPLWPGPGHAPNT